MFILEYKTQQNEMNRHEASMRQQQANVFFPLFSKHKVDVQEKQNHDAKCSLRKPYFSDAGVSTKGDLL